MRTIKFYALIYLTVFLSTFLIPSSNHAQVFTSGSSYALPNIGSILAADFDGDKDIDLAVSQLNDTLIFILSNDGGGHFTATDSLPDFNLGSITVADIDNDGISDLISCLRQSNIVRYWISNGDGTFELGSEEQFGNWPVLCVADFNGDLINDIAYNNIFSGYGISIKFGLGGGLFNTPTVIVSDVQGHCIDAGDLDNDGDMDLVFNSQGIYSILNNGDGTFGSPLAAPDNISSFFITDMNGDQYPDLAGIGQYACAGSAMYMLGTESGIFSEEVMAWPMAGWLGTLRPLCEDFNGDGYTDIAVAAGDGSGIKCRFNNGRMRFDIPEFIELSDSGSLSMASGDFDGDGDVDIMLAGKENNLMRTHSLASAHARRMQIPTGFSTIREAVEYAWNLDTIIVDPGIYKEHIDFGGKNIVLMSSEYENVMKYKKLSYNFIHSASTILDGGDTNRVLTFDNFEDDRSVVAGFTIQNGNSGEMGMGGGIYCYDTAAPTIIHNIIKDNYAGAAGGGLFLHKGKGLIKNNLIINNSSGNWGGGIYVIGTLGSIVCNTVYGNSAIGGGGGLYFNYGSPTISTNIFWNNSSVSNGQQIGYATVQPVIVYCDVDGGWSGEGNIDLYPIFADTTNGDFNLMAGSPCINAGDPNLPRDPDGTVADMGSFYYFEPVNVDEDSDIPLSFYLSQNFPNPFNMATIIEYNLPKAGFVSLEILNVLGQKVKSLVEREQQTGTYRVLWDGSDDQGKQLSTGLYLYRISIGDFVQIKKMLLMK